MFKFSKSQIKDDLKQAQAQFVSQFKPKITVKMIHDEFDTAVDKLINQAIGLKDGDKERHDKLKRLGFTKSKHVSEIKELVQKADNKERISNLVNQYRQRYPFNKFITKELAEDVCKKYGLVLGKVADYIGEIPDKNISEIESFKLLEEDYTELQYCWFHRMDNSHYFSYCEKGAEGAVLGRWVGDDDYVHPRHHCISYSSNMIFEYGGKNETERVLPKFKICAPVKDFDMTNKRVDGVSIVNDVKDPIVLQPVNGGYLIVSKWGDEASDEALVNETMN